MSVFGTNVWEERRKTRCKLSYAASLRTEQRSSALSLLDDGLQRRGLTETKVQIAHTLVKKPVFIT